MDHVIGIDLGTTNSCVAVLVDGIPTVIANRAGYKTTPSMVAISESGRRVVGQMAKRQAITNATHTVYAAKRLIGRKWGSPAINHAVETLPYRIVCGPNDDVRISLRDKVYSIPEVSSMILQELRMTATEFLGVEPTQAVITVPAYFNDAQRQATRDAGRIAGLDVLRIINEPTAAALAYGYNKEMDQKVAVYDLGGGTFDISVLDINNGVFDVLATNGDTFLGGEDFDERIIEWLLIEFATEHEMDLRGNDMAMQRLKDAAEKAKVELSSADATPINLPFLAAGPQDQPLHLERTLTREHLDELVTDLIQSTLRICQRTLDEAGVSTRDVDEVLLVGGMTRMPAIQQAVTEYFGKPARKGVNPDEAVAVGAAIQGFALNSQRRDVLLLDVTPHSLGIMVHGGEFEVLIERNSTVPTSQSHIFTTVRDNQTSVKILVLQGESRRAEENELLGEFVLSGLRQAPAGSVNVEVRFDISADGILAVSARDLETGKEQRITVNSTSGLSEDEIQRMITENEDYMVQVQQADVAGELLTEVRNRRNDLTEILPRVRQSVGGTDLGKRVIEKAENLLNDADSAMRSSLPAHELSALLDRLRHTLDIVNGLLRR